MHSDFRKKYPQLGEILDTKKLARREEIIENLRINDSYYSNILKRRKEQSTIVVGKLSSDTKGDFEKYMDAIYEQSIYELDVLYEIAFCDAIELLEKLNMISAT